MDNRQRSDLDNHITGHYGEDQFVESDELAAAQSTIAAQRREIERLREALKFYADEKTWEMRYDHVPYGSTTAAIPAGTWADDDGGDTARRALGR